MLTMALLKNPIKNTDINAHIFGLERKICLKFKFKMTC